MPNYIPTQTYNGLKEGEYYMWEPNGSGGVDYYLTYGSGGSSTSRKPITREEFANNTGADVGQIESYAQANTGDGGYSTNADAPAGSGLAGGTSGGGGGTAVTPDIKVFKGVSYDLNNANDRGAFIQVQGQEIDKKLSEALKNGQLGYASQLLQYAHDWQKQGEDLMSGYSQGMTARQQNYQGMGTRAYQSSMGASGQNALNKLGEAQTERNYQKNQANSGMEQAYNQFVQGQTENANTLKDTLATDVSGFGAYDASKTPGQADISQYTPYTNFQQLQTSPLVQGGQASKAAQPAMTLSEYLQQLQPGQTNPLEQVLQGKSYV